MRSIAIVGEMSAGKTTLADYLVENHGYTRVSFASRLKQIASAVYNGGKPIAKNDWYEGLVQDGVPVQLSGRRLLQELGQAVKALDERFWVKALLADIDAGVYGDGPYVTDDCRFPFEADALRERGFVVVKIATPEEVRMARYENVYGRKPSPEELSHPSETEVAKIASDAWADGTEPVEVIAGVALLATQAPFGRFAEAPAL